MKEARQAVENVLNLIFFGDWTDQDDFDLQLDQMAEYSNSVRERVNAYNEAMMA